MVYCNSENWLSNDKLYQIDLSNAKFRQNAGMKSWSFNEASIHPFVAHPTVWYVLKKKNETGDLSLWKGSNETNSITFMTPAWFCVYKAIVPSPLSVEAFPILIDSVMRFLAFLCILVAPTFASGMLWFIFNYTRARTLFVAILPMKSWKWCLNFSSNRRRTLIQTAAT